MKQTEKKQRGDQDVLIQYPIHLKKKSGELYWADDISKTIMFEGRPADLISLIDITEKINAEQELKRKNIELSALNRIIIFGNESTSLHEFLEKSYEQVLDSVGFDRGGVYLYDPET